MSTRQTYQHRRARETGWRQRLTRSATTSAWRVCRPRRRESTDTAVSRRLPSSASSSFNARSRPGSRWPTCAGCCGFEMRAASRAGRSTGWPSSGSANWSAGSQTCKPFATSLPPRWANGESRSSPRTGDRRAGLLDSWAARLPERPGSTTECVPRLHDRQSCGIARHPITSPDDSGAGGPHTFSKGPVRLSGSPPARRSFRSCSRASKSSRSMRSRPAFFYWRSFTRLRPRASLGSRTGFNITTTATPAARGEAPTPSVLAELLHFIGEVEVVFGFWAVVLAVAITVYEGWEVAKHYLNDTVNYTEPLFVVVIMALASTRPIIGFAEAVATEGRQRGRRNARRLVDDHPDDRTAARVVHHRAGGHDHLRAPAVAPVLRSAPEHAAEVRDARTVVRERVDRRDADALRGAADPHGGASLGVGHELRHQPFRLAGIRRHPPVERDCIT